MVRLVEARIRGLRTLADVTLRLGGLTVLIGDNGAGKSSILEALRIARLVVRPNLVESLSREHVLISAVRNDTAELKLDLRVEADGRNVVYSLDVDVKGQRITRESISELPLGLDLRAGAASADGKTLLVRTPDNKMRGQAINQHVSEQLSMFEYFGRTPEVDAVAIIREAFEGIDVHLPFSVSAGWATRSIGAATALREPRVIEPSHRLELFGTNLATVYHALKNSRIERWRETMELLQLGIGPELDDVGLSVPGSGHVGLALELRGVQVPAFHLADGHLSYLAFVALVQLDEGRKLLAFDEPEHHLHPGLLTRVVQLLERASKQYPVVIATHSDRLLDCLPDPAAAVRVCELDSQRRTRLVQLDDAQLEKWMKRYGGLGQIRSEGQLRSVIARDEDHAA